MGQLNMGQTVLQSELLAEETHSGRVWSVVILAALLGPALSAALLPSRPARVALGVVTVIGLGALATAWSGFRYRFLRDGVEIWTLGLRLRSIPRQTILSYSIEPWVFIRGYGIRGIGRSRAYVWGNRVVHVRTTKGEVFLGHSEPERIVRDLDRVTGFVTRG
jgi:hypothetical protein